MDDTYTYEFQLALDDWQVRLWRVQMREYPGSVRLTPGDAFKKWCCDEQGNIQQNHKLACFANTAGYPGGVFYECGAFCGYRYGTKGSEYLSGF